MVSRRNILKAGAAFGGLGAFAAGFSETAQRAAEDLLEGAAKKGTTGHSLEPEFRIDAKGELILNPKQQISYTMCLGCTTLCGVRVRIDKETDTVLRVSGNPYHPLSTAPHLPMNVSVRESFLSISRHNERGLEHRSTACGRGNAALENTVSPYRITHPMKRVGPRNSGRWEKISFEQLVQEIVEGGNLFGEGHVAGLKELHSFDPINKEQPELGPKVNQVAMLTSVNDGRENFVRRFMQKSFGSINMVGHGSYCGGSYRSGSGAVFGNTKQMPHAKPDMDHAEFIIFMGTSPSNAGNPFKRQSKQLATARSDGTLKYVVVDPVLTQAGHQASQERANWIPIKPATDAALALGMIQWIIDNKRYDATFLSQPNPKTAEAAGEAAWTNATHLVICQEGHPRKGFFLRGSDMGLTSADTEPYSAKDPFIVVDRTSGAVRPHTDDGSAELLVSQTITVKDQNVLVRSSLELLRLSANTHTLEEYSQICGVPTTVIAGLAKEFTSHGKKAAISTHGGTMAANGFYNAFAIVALNTLIGNLNVKGGTIMNGGGFKEEDGPRYVLDTFDGIVTPKGIPLGRNVAYERTTEFKKKKAAGAPYPAQEPWYPTAPQLATEWFSSAVSGYPYPLKALFLWSTNPVYGIPGLHQFANTALGDPRTIPLIIAMDPFINETSAYADYIVPDVCMYESWGFAAPWAGVPTKGYLTRWPVIAPKTAKNAAGQPIAMESFLIAVAKAMELPGYGTNVIKSEDGTLHPLDSAEDYYLRAAANVAFTGKKPVPDATDDDIQLSGVERIMEGLTATLKADEVRKTAFLFTRGGRYQPADEGFDAKDQSTWKFSGCLNIYNESIGVARNSISGKAFSGVPTWVPPRLSDGSPISAHYPSQEWPLHLISVKSVLQNSYSIGSKHLRTLHPDNPVVINRTDAEQAGLSNGDTIMLETPGGSVKARIIIRSGIMPGVIAVEHGFGHKELGARTFTVDNQEHLGSAGIRAGISINDLGLLDPTRTSAAVVVDPISGTAMRQGIPARLRKVS